MDILNINLITVLFGIFGSLAGAVIAVATLRSKIQKEKAESEEQYINAKKTLMEFVKDMDGRMASYVEQLQTTRQKMLEMEDKHVNDLREERRKTEQALEEIKSLKQAWEVHKLECPLLQNQHQ